MKRDKFKRLVSQAIAKLPEEFQKRLENVVVLVEDRPSRELLDQMEVPPGDTLFGLYEGTPLTERGIAAPLYPDRIWIFKKPIEEEWARKLKSRKRSKQPSSMRSRTFLGWMMNTWMSWDTEPKSKWE